MFKTLLFAGFLILLGAEIGKCIDCRTEGWECVGLETNFPEAHCCLGQQLSCLQKVAGRNDGRLACKKVCSTEGQICGGFTRDPQVCCEGFKCVIPNTGATDLPGKCHSKY